jgi:hypothetical protein
VNPYLAAFSAFARLRPYSRERADRKHFAGLRAGPDSRGGDPGCGCEQAKQALEEDAEDFDSESWCDVVPRIKEGAEKTAAQANVG